MKHLLVCFEYRPAPIPPGGIGTYVAHIARLMAEAGETVHVVGVKWDGAPLDIEEQLDGRLIIHRVPLEEPLVSRGRSLATALNELRGLQAPQYRAQRFALQAAQLIERLVMDEGIDVIESQEYDAPLYIYQLRRALGLGPARTPPCIVQLHSPSEFIFHHNGWDMGNPDFQMVKRMEDFSIGTADALLCPSGFLAAQAEAHYGLSEGSISVLRLPIGDTAEQERPRDVWENDRVCYVGRLEPRKGVIEWVDAAVAVADEHPNARFDFLGADMDYLPGQSVREHLSSRIPRRMRDRFDFRGSRPREEVVAALRGSCAAAVPSRWENFPNTCIEAMCTGTPVIASREGGMAEMVEDGRSGWLAASADPVGLAEALRRALATPATERAAMGKLASCRIRSMCDNQTTLSAHLDFRRRVAQAGAGRSLSLPATLPWARQRLDAAPSPPPAASRVHVLESGGPDGDARRAGHADRASRDDRAGRAGVVVTCRSDGHLLDEALAHVRGQCHPAEAALLVTDKSGDSSVLQAVARARRAGWTVLEVDTLGRGISGLRNAGARRLLRDHPDLSALLFLDERDRIGDRMLQLTTRVLEARPEVAIVVPWTNDLRGGEMRAPASPAFPYQILADDSTPASLLRADALREVDFFNEALPAGYDRWDAVSRVMSQGWIAVTLPELLSGRVGGLDGVDGADGWDGSNGMDGMKGMNGVSLAHPRLRSEMLRALSDELARDAAELVLLLESRAQAPRAAGAGVPLTPLRVLRMPASQQLRVLLKGARSPRRSLSWFRWHLARLKERKQIEVRPSRSRTT